MSRWHKTEWDLLPERAFQPRGWRSGMTLEGGGKGSAAPDPRLAEASLEQVALNREMYADYKANDAPFYRDLAMQALGVSKDNASRAATLSDFQLGQMRYNDDRYRNTLVPVENALIADAGRYDSQAYKDQAVGRAISDTNQAYSNARAQGLRAQSRMGVNPSDAKFFGPQMDIAQANALASAANKTRLAADQVGLSTKMQVYGGLKGIAGLGATNAQLAVSGIGAGNQSGAGMMSSFGSYLGANNSTLGAMNQGAGVGIQGLSNYSSQGIQAQQVNNDASPFAALLGAGAKLGAAYIGSDRRIKKNIVNVGSDPKTGLSLYEFEYIGGDGQRYQGVMADEVQSKYPDAVQSDERGYLSVNYRSLGLEMVAV